MTVDKRGRPPATDGADAAAGDPGRLSHRQIGLLSLTSAAAVANGYYMQPLLVMIGGSMGIAARLLGLLPALSQIGLALGVLFLLPLADILSPRRLLLAVVPVQVAALVLAALSENGATLAAACLLIGLAGITPYVLPPYVSLRVERDEVAWATGVLTRGVIVGILLARTVAGTIGTHLGWRAVYATAACVMTSVAASLRVLVQPTVAGGGAGTVGYRALLGSMWHLARDTPALRAAAATQALTFGSFNVFWVGMVFLLQGPAFRWSPEAVGLVAIIGAVSAFVAPWAGRVGSVVGAHRARTAALAAILFAWAILAMFRHRLALMGIGLLVVDIGGVVVDISNRTILYRLDAAKRSRLNAIYTVAMFTGGGLLSSLVGLCWSISGWMLVCGLGALPILLAIAISVASGEP